MSKHSSYLNIAKGVSKLSEFTQFKLGCIVVYRGTVVSSACNSNKTHTLQKRYNKHRKLHGHVIIHKVHAEVSALAKIRYLDIDWSKVIVYVYREHKNGDVAMSRPCKGCYQAIKEKGIKTIIYTTEEGFAIEKIQN